jgi:hypothetical protein
MWHTPVLEKKGKRKEKNEKKKEKRKIMYLQGRATRLF